MGEIDLNIAINFVKGSAENVPAVTFDNIAWLFFGLIIVTVAFGVFAITKCKISQPVQHAKGLHLKYDNKQNSLLYNFNKSILLYFIVVAVLVSCFAIPSFVNAFAQDSPWVSSTINAYIKEDGSVTFDDGWLQNVSDEDINIRYSSAIKTKDAEKVPALDTANLSILFDNGVLYEGVPSSAEEELTWYSVDIGKGRLTPQQKSLLKFSLTNVNAEDVETLIDKNVFVIKIELWPKYSDITFDACEGQFQDESKQKIISKEDLTQPLQFPDENPIYDDEDYYFSGWFTEPDGEGKQYRQGDYLTDDFTTTLFAYYKQRQVHRIKLNKLGGSGGVEYIYEKYGYAFFKDEECTQKIDKLSMQDLPEMENYNFGGYYFNGSSLIDNEGNLYVDASYFSYDAEMFAFWDGKVYKITLDNTEGTGDLDCIYEKYDDAFYLDEACENKIEYIAASSLPAREHYKFCGYYLNDEQCIDSEGQFACDSLYFKSDATIKAIWDANVYTIYLDDNRGEKGLQAIYEKYEDAFYYDSDCSEKINNNIIALEKLPVRDNFSFCGYRQLNETTYNINDEGKILIKPDKYDVNITNYALWKGKTFTVELDHNGGTQPDNINTIYEQYAKGFYNNEQCQTKDRINRINTPVLKQYRFLGYFDTDGSKCIDEYGNILMTSTHFSEDSTSFKITAKWDAEVYGIKVNPESVQESEFWIYEKYNVGFYTDSSCTKKINQVTVPKKSHYSFLYYKNDNDKITDDKGLITVQPNYFKAPDEINAVWDAKVYTVPIQKVSSTSLEYIYEKYETGFYSNSECTTEISKINPDEKDNYIFNGYYWHGNAITDNESGKILCDNSFFKADISEPVVASWIPKVYSVVLKDGDQTVQTIWEKYGQGFYVDDKCTIKVDENHKVIIPQKEHHKFEGFYLDLIIVINNQGVIDPSCDATVIEEDVELLAHWEENVYTIRLNNTDASATKMIYEKYGVGFYLDSDCTKKINTSPEGTDNFIVLPEYHASKECYGYSYNHALVITKKYAEASERFGYMNCENTTFKDEFTTINPFYIETIFKVTLNNGTSQSYIYEHYGVGFYSDVACTQKISAVDIPQAPVHFDFNGYKYDDVTYIGKDGKLPANTTFLEDCTLNVDWLGEVYKINLKQEGATTPTYSQIYERYNDAFYLDKDCTQAISQIILPQKFGYICSGFYFEIEEGLEELIVDEEGALRKPPVYFEHEAEIYAKFKMDVFSVTLYDGSENPTIIYEKYNQGFYKDKECGTPVRWPITMPKKEALYCTGFFDSEDESAIRYIDDSGNIDKLSPSSFYKDTVIYSHWEERIVTISFLPNYLSNENYTQNLYVKYNDDFYWDVECQQKFDSKITIPSLDNYTFKGYYDKDDTYRYFDEEGSKSVILTTTTFSNSTQLYGKWEKNVYKISLVFDESEQQSEEVSRVFYEKYGEGFFNDPECSEPRAYDELFVLPKYNYRDCLGYFASTSIDSTQYINKDGHFTQDVTYKTFKDSTTLYARLEFRVLKITFSNELTKAETVHADIYAKHEYGFYSNKECTSGNEFSKLDITPVCTDDKLIFAGYYFGETKVFNGVDTPNLEDANRIIVSPSFFKEDVILTPRYESFICGHVSKDPGDTGRADLSIVNQTINIELTNPDTLEIKSYDIEIQHLNVFTGYFYCKLEESWEYADSAIKYSNLGYGCGHLGSGSYYINLVAKLALDNYDTETLSKVADNIATYNNKSIYYNEFKRYMDTDTKWFSHSCGLFDINNPNPTARYVDKNYKCNFETGDEDKYKDEINQYVFFQIIGINHDSKTEKNELLPTGLTLQFARCLPMEYQYDSDGSLRDYAGWAASDIRKTLNEGKNAIYNRICEPLKKIIVTDIRKTSESQKEDVTESFHWEVTEEKLFLLSYREMIVEGTHDIEEPTPLIDHSEGEQYQWYKQKGIRGDYNCEETNEALADQGFTNNGFSVDIDPALRWIRTVHGKPGIDFFACKHIEDWGCCFRPRAVDNKLMINPAFCIGKNNNRSDKINGKVSFDSPDNAEALKRLEDQSFTYSWTEPVSQTTFMGIEKFKDYNPSEKTLSFTIEGLPDAMPVNISIKTNRLGFLGEQDFNNVVAGQESPIWLTVTLSLDNYTFEDLNWVSNCVARMTDAERQNSSYLKEFNSYLNDGAVWYSHSCGKFDPNNIDGTIQYLDSKYKNNFYTDPDKDSKSEINQYLFLRLVGVEHDDVSNPIQGSQTTKAFLTFQPIHRLPKLYAYDSSGDQSNSVLWNRSTIRFELNDGEIYQGLNSEIRKYICNTNKTFQNDKSETSNMGISQDKLFLLSYKEMYTQGSETPGRSSWYYDNTEGYQYQWYTKNHILGNNDMWELWLYNEVLKGMCSLNSGNKQVNLWERTIGLHSESSGSNNFMYINPGDQNGVTIFRDNAPCYTSYGICPCFCLGTEEGPVPETAPIVNVKVEKNAGDTGRTDVYDVENIPVTYQYKNSAGSTVYSTVYTDKYGDCTLHDLPLNVQDLDLYILCDSGKGYFGEAKLKVSSGNIYDLLIQEKLNLDNYTTDELKVISNDIKKNHASSVYFKEFNAYLENNAIWYSRSCGRFDPNNPNDTTYLDKNYKCAFRDPSGASISEVNNYLFLRILDVNSSDANGNYVGLTMQTIHCLPILYSLDEDSTEAPQFVFWKGSTLDEKLEEGSIFTALSNKIKNSMIYTYKVADKLRTEARIPADQTEIFSRHLIIPSASEMVQKYSLEKDIFGVWNFASMEGNRFKWYANHNFDGSQEFVDDEINLMAKCNDGNRVAISGEGQNNTILWTRSPYPMPSPRVGDKPKFLAIHFLDNGHITIREAYDSNIKALVAPIFTL